MKQLNLNQVFDDFFQQTIFKNRNVLSSDYKPTTPLHRNEQLRQLASILAPALHGGKMSNVFIYGKTGTGKTLVVKTVASELEKRNNKIKTMYVNCKMKRISDTEYRLLAELSRALGQNVPITGLPTDHVYRLFFDGLETQAKNIILILDEIDALVAKIGDEILYNLTRINQDLRKSRVSVIGISNNVAFTETLDPRVKSSLSEEEIVFPPYNATQLNDILTQRAHLAFYDNILEDGVISKCAALAAQEHGDARKALDILRIAAELVEREGSTTITTKHVDMAENKLDSDRTITVVKYLPKQSMAVLTAIVKLREKNHSDIQTGDVYSYYEKICAAAGLKTLTQRRVSDLVAELDMLAVINARVISKGRFGRTREIRLLLDDGVLDKIKETLKENSLL